VKTLRRCPKCRSAAIVLVEIATVGIPFEQTVSGRWRRVLSDAQPEPFMVQGECRDCDHYWRVPKWSAMWVDTDGLDHEMLPGGAISSRPADLDRMNDPPVPLRVKP
jgi:predicted nucleic-acid-binding Zn-ribbon protein